MTRSLFRKADGPSPSSYRKSVAIKLAAFGLALAIFFPLTALLSRPKPLKDFSDGVLPLTFSTRNKDLQRELFALNVSRALPKQRAETQSTGSRRLCEAIETALSGPEFQRMKTDLDQFTSSLASQGRIIAAGSLQEKLDFLWQSQGQFDSSFEMRQLQRALQQAFSYGETSQAMVSLKYLEEEGASPLPELLEMLEAKFAIQLSCSDFQGALKTLELLLKMSNCILNSDEPDIRFLDTTLELVAQSLQAHAWTSDAALKDLQALLQRQRGRPSAQRNILAFEREQALLSFEKVRRYGLRSVNGSAPGASIVADSLRELKPSGALKVADSLWRGLNYKPDDDEVQTLKLFARLSGPGFMPFFKATPLLGANRDDGPLFAKTKIGLWNSLRAQSETIARLEAMDMAIRLHFEMEVDKSRTSPVNGQPYGILKGQGHYKITYGQTEGDALRIDN